MSTQRYNTTVRLVFLNVQQGGSVCVSVRAAVWRTAFTPCSQWVSKKKKERFRLINKTVQKSVVFEEVINK